MNSIRNAIGFAGVKEECVVLWSAFLFSRIKQKVLIMDFCEFSDLKSCIPLPRPLADVMDQVYEFHGIHYICARKKRIEDFASRYDVILADFGRTKGHPELNGCHTRFLFTDMLPYHISSLNFLKRMDNQYLVIRDYRRGKIDSKTVASGIHMPFIKVFTMEPDETEEMQYIENLYLGQTKLKHLSADMEMLLLFLMAVMNNEEMQCRKTLKKIRKGKCRL